MMTLSIVIPTLNEEKYLPFLLGSIKKQKFQDFEVIIADANSEDKTIEVAKKENCKIVLSGGRLPAKEKNKGALSAKGDVILFLDADIVLPDNFLRDSLREFKKRNLDIASFSLSSFEWFHRISSRILYNLPAALTEKSLPQAMNAILVKKIIHEKINGFDEKIKIGEELDYVRRGAKIGKFGNLKRAKIIISPRRFQQDGWFKTWLKYFLCQLHMVFLGPVKSDILKYKFNHYLKKPKNQLE